MMNPDGVINGNYRCSLIGKDLNRMWDKPPSIMAAQTPEVFSLKRLMKHLVANGGLEVTF